MIVTVHYAKPKFTMDKFNKGNLYEIDEDCLKKGKPISDSLTIKDKNKNWTKVSAFDFKIISCLFNKDREGD